MSESRRQFTFVDSSIVKRPIRLRDSRGQNLAADTNSCERLYQAQRGLAAAFDLAAFGLYMIVPVKKSVNHSKTLTSMREVRRSLARTTRECVFFLFVVTRLWKRNSLFVIVYLLLDLLVFLATVQRLGITFL